MGGSNEAYVTNTVVTATTSNLLVVDPQGSPYQYSNGCPVGQICYDQGYIGYTGTNLPKNANINWNVQIFCSNSPYPSETAKPSTTITCQ
jgi:hypothetical protein